MAGGGKRDLGAKKGRLAQQERVVFGVCSVRMPWPPKMSWEVTAGLGATSQ